MSAVVNAPRARWTAFAWVALVAGWVCLIAPGPGVLRTVGIALVAVGLVLSVLTIARGGKRAGVAPLIAGLLVTPLVYFGAAKLLPAHDDATATGSPSMTSTTGAPRAAATGPVQPVVPSAPRPDIAFRSTVTAVELSSAYDAGVAAADKQFKGQRLLVAGMVDSLDPDAAGGPVVSLTAGEFKPVQALGLERDAAAALRVGQQIILACNGAGAPGGKATVDGCKVTTQ